MIIKKQRTSNRIPPHLRRKLTPKEALDLMRMKRVERKQLGKRGGTMIDLNMAKKLMGRGATKREIEGIFKWMGKSPSYTARVLETARKTLLAQGKR